MILSDTIVEFVAVAQGVVAENNGEALLRLQGESRRMVSHRA